MYELTHVSKTFRQGAQTIAAVDNVSLVIATGEIVAVQGPSGCGKSTLLQLIGGLDAPTAGRITYGEHELTGADDRTLTRLRLRAFGFVFQQFHLIPTLTARENVEAALMPTGMRAGERRKRCKDLLDQVGMAHRSDHLPSRLSGGEQQRVAVARALANEPEVLLADEPTGNLDRRTGDHIIDLLVDRATEHGRTLVLVTHDELVARRAQRVLLMVDGTLQE